MSRSLRSWLWRVPVDLEVDQEIAFHVEMRTRELIARGVPPREARDLVLSRLGDLKRLKRTCVDLGRKRDREMRLTQWLEELTADVRSAFRQLRASPGFTVVAAITLALGVGANSAIFALADAALLRPLPFAEPERLVMVSERTLTAPRIPMSPLNLRDVAEQNRSFEALGAVQLGAGGGPLVTAPDGSVESHERQSVSTQFFDVLGVTPIVGRTFRAADEGRTTTVVVFGEAMWRRRFGADPDLVGQQVRLNGAPFTVVGVVPDTVQFTRPAAMWTLNPEIPDAFNQRGFRFFEVVARLKPGVSIEAARADLEGIGARLARDFPESNKGFGMVGEPLRDGTMGRDLQLTSAFLLGVVGFVLLLCCANVANLLLARGSARGKELAVRAALGAGKRRIAAQLLTESLVLATLGGSLGLALGAAVLRVAPTFLPPGLLPPVARLAFDGRVVAFSVLAALLVGILFGVGPAWQATKASLLQTLASDSRSATTRGGRFRGLLVAAEVAAAVLLLSGAGLLLRTFLVLARADPGYRAESASVLTLDFSLPFGPGTARPTSDALLQFYDTVGQEIEALPEVHRAGWSSSLPYGTTEFGPWSFEVIGDPPVAPGNRPSADYAVASPSYFTTLDLPIVAGRGFNEQDTAASSRICIVNEAFVRRHFRGRNPIGARIVLRQTAQAEPIVREIVGVARQVTVRPATPEEALQVYVPLTQHPTGDVYLVVQPSSGPAEALTPLVRAVVARHDPNTPVRRDRTLEFLSVQSTAGFRFRAGIAATFAGLALTLAMVGVFGLLAYSVQQRTREFGVRLALGARRSSVLALVLRGAGRLVAIGGLVGLGLAVVLARSMTVFLFKVEPLDPVTFGGVVLVLGLTAAAAAAAPAWRASRVDPVVAFRHE